MNTPQARTHDVIIMGGGLAGLTLALQLRKRLPGLDIQVLERRQHPVPEAAFKIGESTVEIGAHYFADVLGLKQHLVDAQLKKFGFRFFFSEGRRDFDAVTELGASQPLPVGSWQIDRGIFENFLGQETQRRGIAFTDGTTIRDVKLSTTGDLHEVRWTEAVRSENAAEHATEQAAEQTARARWVIDACGRAGLIKKKLGLARENAHAAHAVWFRIADRIVPDDWSDNADWSARCVTRTRWMSTNHLVGAGYWVWLIPLSSGSHSVGIVADPRWHPLDTMNTFDKAMDWLEKYQPRLFDDLDPKRDKLQDFAFFRRFSYDCEQVFSKDRWALAGEAGRFLDPFYSPGSDFIAIGNTYITDLVARDMEGQPIGARTALYEQIFKSFYDNTMALYLDQYGIFGDPEVLPLKVFWDYTYYWGVLARLFFHGGLTDMETLTHLRNEMGPMQDLNLAMQNHVRALCQHSRKRNQRVLLDQASLPWFAELNRSMADKIDNAEFGLRLKASAVRLRELATEILDRSTLEYPLMDGSALRTAIDTAGGPVRGGTSLLFPALREDAVAA
jgi:flavin-dependent dehydrogenase